ncbi:Cytochrome c2 [Roseospirillum parvum]|uniref:Cytochrome c2 n=2 Tax=Roseospirillum parvum TaxID=83401 RepID=A0A1G7TXZ4_9PROT|nr:Cytochrome c2 [Roseospirillum parvum]
MMVTATLIVGTLATVAPVSTSGALAQDAARGARLAAEHCARCHYLTPELGNSDIGPGLVGVTNRPPGSGAAGPGPANDSYPYGEDFKQAMALNPWQWTGQTLDAYIRDPTLFLRQRLGRKEARSKMTYKIPDPGDRADIIEFLRQLR